MKNNYRYKQIMYFKFIALLLFFNACSSKIYDAIKNGNINEIQKYIQNGGNINIRKSCYNCNIRRGETLLEYASKIGNLDMVKFLIDNGAHLNDSIDIQEPIYMATYYKKYEKNPDPRYDDYKPFHNEIIKLLINSGEKVRGYDLITACINHDYELVKLFVDNGADINFRDEDGYTALMYAICSKNQNIVELLNDKGAKISTDISVINLDQENTYLLIDNKIASSSHLQKHIFKITPGNQKIAICYYSMYGNLIEKAGPVNLEYIFEGGSAYNITSYFYSEISKPVEITKIY